MVAVARKTDQEPPPTHVCKRGGVVAVVWRLLQEKEIEKHPHLTFASEGGVVVMQQLSREKQNKNHPQLAFVSKGGWQR